jgi:hypothetical protein
VIFYFVQVTGLCEIISKYFMQARGRVPVRAVPGAGAAGAGFATKSHKKSARKICFQARNPVSQAVFIGSIALGNGTKTTNTHFPAGF